MGVLEKLNSIFCEVFDDESIMISTDTTAGDIEGWDSLSHINLIVAVEMRFNIKFSNKELLTLKNVGDLINCINSKLS